MYGMMLGLALAASLGEPPGIAVASYTPRTEDLRLYTEEMASKYGVSYHELYTTIDGESNWKTDACGDNGASCGVVQFQRPTFENFRDKAIELGEPFHDLRYEDSHDQIQLMAWAFKWSEEYKEHWTCYRARVSGTLPESRCPF